MDEKRGYNGPTELFSYDAFHGEELIDRIYFGNRNQPNAFLAGIQKNVREERGLGFGDVEFVLSEEPRKIDPSRISAVGNGTYHVDEKHIIADIRDPVVRDSGLLRSISDYAPRGA